VLRRSVISVAATREDVSWPLADSASAFAITPASSSRAGPGGSASRALRASFNAASTSCCCAHGSAAARATTRGASSRVRCRTAGSRVFDAAGSSGSCATRAFPWPTFSTVPACAVPAHPSTPASTAAATPTLSTLPSLT
jgi:hypothetical protein